MRGWFADLNSTIDIINVTTTLYSGKYFWVVKGWQIVYWFTQMRKVSSCPAAQMLVREKSFSRFSTEIEPMYSGF